MTKPGSSKQAIARAAARMFAEHGYAQTSLRQIAAEAGVDAALAIRHFGSKEALFLETISFEGEAYATLFEGPREDLGRRIVVGILAGFEEETFGYFAALVRCSDLASVQERLRDASTSGFVQPLAARLEGPNAEVRAQLVLSQVNGLLLHLSVIVDPVLLSITTQQLADAYGPALQILIGGPMKQ